jgi:hypothetical protein
MVCPFSSVHFTHVAIVGFLKLAVYIRFGWRNNVMPRGPKGEKHLADIVDHAVLVMKIATGELEDQSAQKTPGLLRLVDWAEKEGGKGNSLIPFGGTRAPARGGLAWQNQRDTLEWLDEGTWITAALISDAFVASFEAARGEEMGLSRTEAVDLAAYIATLK